MNAPAHEQQFVNIPATIRRHAFLQGRVSAPQLFTPRPARRKTDEVDKPKTNGWRATGNKSGTGPVSRKLHATLSIARLTREKRKSLLAQKCLAAGVTNAVALSLAKQGTP